MSFTLPLRAAFSLVALATIASLSHAEPMTYPQTRRGDQVDAYHGEQVADPYRWLEDDARTSKEVADWVAAENEVTRKFLDAIPEREEFRKRLSELWNYELYSAPWKMGERYFFLKNDGLQNQAVLYWSETYDGD